MSKKKNTLKDLDEFLKQQAATLVSPPRLAEQKEHTQPKEAIADNAEGTEANGTSASPENILRQLKELAHNEGPAFLTHLCDLIIKTMESQNNFTAEDRMLINTALYLKSGSQWKETIRAYWKQKNNAR